MRPQPCEFPNVQTQYGISNLNDVMFIFQLPQKIKRIIRDKIAEKESYRKTLLSLCNPSLILSSLSSKEGREKETGPCDEFVTAYVEVVSTSRELTYVDSENFKISKRDMQKVFRWMKKGDDIYCVWGFETDNVKWVISERTLKAQFFPKGENWLKDLGEYLGAWVVQELKGAKITMHGAINKKEYDGYRAGVLEVVQDHSEWKEGEYEFHGPEDAVKTAMGLSLTGLFTPEQSAKIADMMHTYNEKHKSELEHLVDELTLFAEFTTNNLNYLSDKLKKHDDKFEEINNQIESLKNEVKENLNTIAGGIRLILNKPQIGTVKGEVEGYA